MERFENMIITIFVKNSIQIFERVLNMCLVLNMSEFWVFVNFRKYDRVLKMRQDTIMEGFGIFQDSEYARFLSIQVLHKILNMPEYDWIMPYDRVLNMSVQS